MLAASLAPWLARRGIHYGWVMVVLTFLTALCAAAGTGLPGILIVPISLEFHWTRGDISGALALMLAMFGTMAPFGGALMIRYGLRRVVVAAALMVVIALVGTAWMTAKWQLWVFMGFFLGTAAGTTAFVLSATVANRWFVQRRGLVMGVLTAAVATGQLIFLPTAAWLATTYGWRAAVVPGAVGSAVCAILYILLARDWPADIGLAPYGDNQLREPPTASAGNAVSLSFAVLRQATTGRAFWVLAGTFFICGVSTAGTVQQHFVPYCIDNGLSAISAASILAMMGLFNFFGTIGSGWLSDRFDNRVLLAWYYGLRGLSLIWLPFGRFDVVSLSLFAVFFGLDFLATVPPTVKLAANYFGAEKAPIVFGWALASHQLAAGLATLATGISRDMFATYFPAFFTAGVVCLLASVAIFSLRPNRPAAPAVA